jgi:zinc/manganese transport system ATP-binding protein
VHHLSFSLPEGGLMAVVGPNGAGKSSLLRALAGLQAPSGGRITGAGPARVALLPQQSALDRTFPLTCRDAVLLGLWAEGGGFRSLRDAGRVAQALDAVGLHGFGGRPVSSLSTGQFQRVLFARLLLQDAPVILLDEPFNALDARTASDLLAVVRRWHGEGRSVLAVRHDLDPRAREFPAYPSAGPRGPSLAAEARRRRRFPAANRARAQIPKPWMTLAGAAGARGLTMPLRLHPIMPPRRP